MSTIEYAIRQTTDQVREAGVIPNIPTQPLGYEDAQKFLEALPSDMEVNQTWRGALPITYHYGGALTDGK